MIAMSCAKCRPIQFFLYWLGPAPPPSPVLHLLSLHTPESQSALVSQLGAASQVPSPHCRPSLHSVELSQGSPQALWPCLAAEQPGKSGGHSPFAMQRAGAGSRGDRGGGAWLS